MSTVVDSFDLPKKGKSKTRARVSVPQLRKLWILPPTLVLAVLGLSWNRDWFSGQPSVATGDLLTYEVQPRDLPITVIERGNLDSQTNVPVYCKVDDYRSDGILGTPIVWVIANGSSVKEGDLICELDSTAIQSELDEQILDTEEARSALLQAQANLENQEIQNTTAEFKSQLDIKLANLELDMFQDEHAGSHHLALEAIERQIDDLNSEILAARMNKKLAKNEMVGIESLFKLGYAGKSELDRSELNYLKAEGDYAAKLNKLTTHLASLEKLTKFDKEMQLLELQGKVETAMQASKQVELSNKAKKAQLEGILTSRKEQLTKEEERLKRYTAQLSYCKIVAPQDGMVAYATPTSSRDSEIAEGVPVRPRQHILSIPNLKRMEVKTKVHESVLDRIDVGLEVAVTVDAFPGREYKGTVKSVAVLPERTSYSDTRSYETIITIDEDVEQLKPGMTAVSEIKVDYLSQVNAVPIQAIIQRSGTNWIYVDQSGAVERREISLGQSNDQYVCILDGLNSGERVVLNPAALLDDDEEVREEQFAVNEKETGETSLIARTSSDSSIK